MSVPVSVTMAMEALREQAEAVRTRKQQYDEAIAVRDNLIRDCRAAKIPEGKIMTLTGLSRNTVHRIAHSGPRGVSLSEQS